MENCEPIADRIQRVAAKINKRGIKLGDPVTESEVIGFEERYRISLPGDYREFILRIGNGAPGPPAYGLVELADAPVGRADWKSHTADELQSMRKIFPFTRPWVWEAGEASDEGADDQVRDGQLYLGTDGCGMDWGLIITGPDRGRIWLLTGEGITPTTPKRDFLRWFEDWLDGVRDWWR